MGPQNRITSVTEAKDSCSNPPMSCRSAPFWGWNSRMRLDRLKEQMLGMKRQGIGGFFIHSREGLETPYLTREWMDLVVATVEEAERLGLEAWIYDEDKWPSGSAGGKVGALDPSFIAKGLTFDLRKTEHNLPEPDGYVIGRYPYHHGMEIILRMETSLPSEWYNGMAPTDNLNPKAVQAFIRLTHEAYQAHIGKAFGKSVQGFFTDEPNCFDFFTHFQTDRPWVPWTEELLDCFILTRGYDPTPYLPFLFAEDFKPANDKIDRVKLRHDYWRTVAERFAQSYMKPVYDWCADNGLLSAGHMLYENDLGYQVRVCGAVMPQYRYLHAPSVDILGEQTLEYLTVKQCTSVAHQYGREMTFAEVYGCTGWELTFEGQQWLMNWLYAMGITRMCQHLALYSITGCRKRDYPPVFNEQTTWWDNDHYLEDERARIAAALSAGEVVRDVLVIHPISSAWCACGSAPDENLSHLEMNMGWTDETFMSLNRWGEAYNRLAEMLVQLHIDFDFGDETILAEIGAVENDKIRVGRAQYSTVIVPRVYSLFRSTCQLLQAFANAGGTVIWVKPYPERMEGERTPEIVLAIEDITKSSAFYAAEDDHALSLLLQTMRDRLSRVSLCGHTHLEDIEILTMLRHTEDGWILFLANHDRRKPHRVTVSLQACGTVEDFNPMDGTARSMDAHYGSDNHLHFYTEVPASGCRLFFIRSCALPQTDAREILVPYRHPHATERVLYTLETVDSYHRTMENILTLDRCRYSLGGEPWEQETEVWMAQREMRKSLGMRPVYYNGAPQRYTWIYSEPDRTVPFSLSFPFVVKDLPDKPVFVAVEHAQTLRITCNGVVCDNTGEWLMDRDLVKFRLNGLRKGVQELVIAGDYHAVTELENIYITGDFGVDEDRALVREKNRLRFGNFCRQGYPHYPGGMVCVFVVPPLSADWGGSSVHLQVSRFDAELLKVWVNGSIAGILRNAAETLDITALMRREGNTVSLEAVGTPRNMMGPFHRRYAGCSRISWEDFRAEGNAYTPEYHTVPFGIAGPITLLLKTL